VNCLHKESMHVKRKTTNLQKRLYLISAIILMVGLSSSIWIYLTAENYSKNILGYEVAGDNAYLITPENSKKYVHDLELYGGKANVLANELMIWFDGLWQGKSLALTISCVTLFIALGFFFAARATPSHLEYDAHDENDQSGSK
jgi:hypothetical protein